LVKSLRSLGRMVRRAVRREALAVAGLAACVTLLDAGAASARRNGIIAPDCGGCHRSGGAVVEVSAAPAAFAPGDDVTFTITVRRESGNAVAGGLSVTQPKSGELHTLPGEGLTLVPASGLTHSQPKPAVGGVATFRFGWRAPAEPGGVTFDVAAVAADGDQSSGGDAAGTTRFATAFGCSAATHYPDYDGDGYGIDVFERSVGCAGVAPPAGYSTTADDCNDNDAAIHPSASELCNKKDDDCDGELDEDSTLVELWPDDDGDGYYRTRTGTPVLGCVGLAGYAADSGDCSPLEAEVHPGATEVCNLIDDNCDGREDERVRPQCGIGWCRRESRTCSMADCTPGEPQPERCNLLDDDCNDDVDDGDICPTGSVCLAGKCVAVSGDPSVAGSGGTAPSGGAGPSGGSTPAGGASGGAASPGGGENRGGPSAREQATTAAGCALARGASNGRGTDAFAAVLAVSMLAGWRALRRGVRRRHSDELRARAAQSQ
jgi:hypothetical protein